MQKKKKNSLLVLFQSHLNPLHIYFDKVLLSPCRISETDASWPCHLKRSLLCAASHSPLLLYNKNTVSSTCAASLYIKPLSEIYQKAKLFLAYVDHHGFDNLFPFMTMTFTTFHSFYSQMWRKSKPCFTVKTRAST